MQTCTGIDSIYFVKRFKSNSPNLFVHENIFFIEQLKEKNVHKFSLTCNVYQLKGLLKNVKILVVLNIYYKALSECCIL